MGALGDTLLRELAAAGLLEGRALHVFGVEGWPACGTPPEALRAAPARRRLARGADRGGAPLSGRAVKRIWLVLPDPLPTRVFFDCGIVDRLRERLPRPARARLRRRRSGAVARARGRPPRAGAGDAPPAARRPRRARPPPGRPLPRRPRGLLPARAPGEPAARVPPAADAPRPRQLVPRPRPRRPAAEVALAGTGDVPLALQLAALRAVASPAPHAGGLRRPRRREPPDAQRRPVPDRGAPARDPGRRLRLELGPHRRQGRDQPVRGAVRRPERDDAARPRALPRDRAGARRGDGLAADGRLPRAAAARAVRGARAAASASIRRGRSCS